MPLLIEKVILLVLLLLFGLGAGICPHLLRNRCLSPSRSRDRLVSLLNCFSAGVFFATFFMHMMPEGQEEFSMVFEEAEYPYAELLVCVGFFFVMAIEQLVMNWYERKRKLEKESQAIEPSSTKNNNNNCNPIENHIQNLNEDQKDTKSNSNQGSHLTSGPSSVDIEMKQVEDVLTDNEKQNKIKKQKSFDLENNHLNQSGSSHDGHEHMDPHFSIRAFILLFALSTHALFEGLAIGFQTSASALRSLLFAVVIHKMALAFSLGISLVNNQANFSHVFLSMLIFSVMAPIGIGIGTALNSIKSANTTVEMVVAVMQAFAAGTFVYVIFIEIIPHEFVTSKSEFRLVKLFFLAIGFAAMAGLQAIPHEEE